MKISESASFPHPILAPWSSDISGAGIDAEFVFRENQENDQVSVHCTAELNHPDIVQLISEGSATFGCYIRCQETGLRRLQPFGFPTGVHHFAPGAFLGLVHLRPIVWTTAPVDDYRPAGANSEFANGSALDPGSILAVGDEQIIEAKRPPLPSLESIFKIELSEEIPEGKFNIDTDADYIAIIIGSETFKLVQSLRQNDGLTRAVVMNSLYVPVVMQVLEHLAAVGFESFEQHRWLHPFRSRCERVGIDLTNLELLSDAQLLLEQPFASLGQLIDQEAESEDATA